MLNHIKKALLQRRINKDILACQYAVAYYGDRNNNSDIIITKHLKIVQKRIGELFTVTVSLLENSKTVLSATHKVDAFGNRDYPDFRVKVTQVDIFEEGYWEEYLDKLYEDVLSAKKRSERRSYENHYFDH